MGIEELKVMGVDPEMFKRLRLRAEELLREYRASKVASEQGGRSQEALVEIGAEILSRSRYRIPKKTVRSVGLSGKTAWRSSEQFRKIEEQTDRLVVDARIAVKALKDKAPSFRAIYEAAMPDTKLNRMTGVLETAERRARMPSRKRKA